MKERAWGAAGSVTVASAIVKALNSNHWWVVLSALFVLAVLLILAVCWAVKHIDADEVRVTKTGITVKRRAAPEDRDGFPRELTQALTNEPGRLRTEPNRAR